MNHKIITIVSAPDYVMIKDFVVFHHIVTLIIEVPPALTHRETISHRSLRTLIKQLIARKEALAPGFVGPLHWSLGSTLKTELPTLRGRLCIEFRLPQEMAREQRAIHLRNLIGLCMAF